MGVRPGQKGGSFWVSSETRGWEGELYRREPATGLGRVQWLSAHPHNSCFPQSPSVAVELSPELDLSPIPVMCGAGQVIELCWVRAGWRQPGWNRQGEGGGREPCAGPGQGWERRDSTLRKRLYSQDIFAFFQKNPDKNNENYFSGFLSAPSHHFIPSKSAWFNQINTGSRQYVFVPEP